MLRRSTPKRKPGASKVDRIRREWAAEHLSCAACGFREGQLGGWLETHHVIKRSAGGPDDPRNYLRLCIQYDGPSCHKLAEGESVRRDDGELWPVLTIGMQLTLKRESDQENYDPEWMLDYRHWLPNPEPVPECFIRERERNMR